VALLCEAKKPNEITVSKKPECPMSDIGSAAGYAQWAYRSLALLCEAKKSNEITVSKGKVFTSWPHNAVDSL
jgi:glutamine synthetase type III